MKAKGTAANIFIAFGLCLLTALILDGLFHPFSKIENQSSSSEENKATPEPTPESLIPVINQEINSFSKHNRDFFTEGLSFDNKEVLFETGGRYEESKLGFYEKNPEYECIGFWGVFFCNLNDKEKQTETENKSEDNERKEIEFEINENNSEKENENVSEYLINQDSVAYFPKQYFIEGATYINNYLYILTWKENKIFKYDLDSQKVIAEKEYKYEGWGLTNDGKYLYASDGSNKIHVYTVSDSFDLNEIRVLEIKDENDNDVVNINELEYINGYIFANIWQTNDIIVIDSENGKIVQKYNFDFLNEYEDERSQEMNGIAYNPFNKKLYITGKYWKWIYSFRIENQ